MKNANALHNAQCTNDTKQNRYTMHEQKLTQTNSNECNFLLMQMKCKNSEKHKCTDARMKINNRCETTNNAKLDQI